MYNIYQKVVFFRLGTYLMLIFLLQYFSNKNSSLCKKCMQAVGLTSPVLNHQCRFTHMQFRFQLFCSSRNTGGILKPWEKIVWEKNWGRNVINVCQKDPATSAIQNFTKLYKISYLFKIHVLL